MQLPLVDVAGLKPDGTLAANAFGLAGRVVVIGQPPLLEATNDGPTGAAFTLYGLPGVSYVISAAAEFPASAWEDVRTIRLSGLGEEWPVEPAERQLFYRASEE